MDPFGRVVDLREKTGDDVDVWAYSNCDEVEIFLNHKSLGKKIVPKYSHVSWNVKYEPGTLTAIGYTGGKEVVADSVETTATPDSIQLIPDRHTINADGEDVSVVTVRVVDSLGRTVPIADNEINFSLKGAGKIIGVGNGDPSSHEPEKYIETVSAVKIENLKMRAIGISDSPGDVISVDYDDSGWEQAFTDGDREDRLTPAFGELSTKAGQNSAKSIVVRGTFNLPEIDDSSRITLFGKSICQSQTIYINGHLIAKGVERDALDQQYILDHSFLHTGKNIFTVVGPPLVKKTQWEILNKDPGMIQVFTQAKSWKRKAFNGLAQVIIQSAKMPGQITVTASSNNLSSATVMLESKQAGSF